MSDWLQLRDVKHIRIGNEHLHDGQWLQRTIIITKTNDEVLQLTVSGEHGKVPIEIDYDE